LSKRALSLLSLFACLAAMLSFRTARAEGPLSFEGGWKQGALHEEYTVQQWLPGCGPAPVTGTTGGGDTVTIRQEGDELTFVGAGRVFQTNQCYDKLPTLARDAHSRDPSGRSWRTHCATPPSDPRRAIMNTLVVATTDTHIDVVETGQYYIKLNEGTCLAEVKRSQGYDLVQSPPPAPSATPSAPAPVATPATPTKPAACIPEGPARLEVRPSRKLMRPGETFAFRAVVTDASGCPTGTPTTWALADSADSNRGLTLERSRVTIAADAPEGTTELIASAANKSVRVTVQVASAAHYDDLLGKQGLGATGESDAAATALIAGGSIGGGDAKAEDGARKRKTIFVAIVGTLVGVLGIIAIVYVRRAGRAKRLEAEQVEHHAERVREIEDRKRLQAEAHAAQMRAHQESVERAKVAAARVSGTMFCPTCKREYPPPAGNFCPQDATRLVVLAENQNAALTPAGGVCPVCRRGFAPGVKVCPTDHEELVPYAAIVATAAVSAKGKICPTCGDRFEGAATFCGKDGTALVLLN
jgi:hypothetical protein